jgi:tRNA pseudouridine(55) synthase
MEQYITLEKAVGETPLSCLEAWRANHPQYAAVPLAYAGRLDPMASGKLLVLIGEECKRQTEYHDLDKAYEFSVLLGLRSDTLDVLGRIEPAARETQAEPASAATLTKITDQLTGEIELPYPQFSARTVKGKPLHTWTLEGRLDEIEIPTKRSVVYELTCTGRETKSRTELCAEARAKIDRIPTVSDPRKTLGADFRRVDVRADWERSKHDDTLPEQYTILHFSCVASSGTYMRSLGSEIAKGLGTVGLAWHIHRVAIGRFDPTSRSWSLQY